jgi:hypothetical protein
MRKATKTVFLTVSEYGEFFHLLGLASAVATAFGLHPVFLFKAGYGALDRHSQIVEARGFSWILENNARIMFDLSGIASADDDYVPSYVLSARDASTSTAGAPRGLLTVAYAIYRIAANIGKLIALVLLPILLPISISAYVLRHSTRPLALIVSQKRLKRAIWSSLDPRNAVKIRLRNLARHFYRFNPVMVISGQDYPLSVTTLAASIAEARGIPTVIVPFSMTPTTKEVAESFAGLGINRVRGLFRRRLLLILAPRWLHRYRGRTYMRLPFHEILASETHKLTPPQPWTPNSGRGVVFAASRQSVDYCLSAGIPPNQLRLTGALWNDELDARNDTRETRRAALIREIQLAQTTWQIMQWRGLRASVVDPDTLIQDNKKLILVSWPPNQWPRNATGFSAYEDFNRGLVDMLASIKHARYANIVISLHPTLVGTEHASYIRQAGLVITDADLIDVIDCADIFTATVSSTLLWSLRCAIPSINFDPYRYQYREFREAGMLEAATVRQLRQLLLSLVTEDGVFRETKERMLASRDYWTARDGHSRERIIAAIGILMQSSRSQAGNKGDFCEAEALAAVQDKVGM